jgi:hypothetical protein
MPINIIWKRAAMPCCATKRFSASGAPWGWNSCLSGDCGEQRQLTSLDYLLYEIQHAVRAAHAVALAEIYTDLVRTQQVLNRKHLGWSALRKEGRGRAAGIA